MLVWQPQCSSAAAAAGAVSLEEPCCDSPPIVALFIGLFDSVDSSECKRQRSVSTAAETDAPDPAASSVAIESEEAVSNTTTTTTSTQFHVVRDVSPDALPALGRWISKELFPKLLVWGLQSSGVAHLPQGLGAFRSNLLRGLGYAHRYAAMKQKYGPPLVEVGVCV